MLVVLLMFMAVARAILASHALQSISIRLVGIFVLAMVYPGGYSYYLMLVNQVT